MNLHYITWLYYEDKLYLFFQFFYSVPKFQFFFKDFIFFQKFQVEVASKLYKWFQLLKYATCNVKKHFIDSPSTCVVECRYHTEIPPWSPCSSPTSKPKDACNCKKNEFPSQDRTTWTKKSSGNGTYVDTAPRHLLIHIVPVLGRLFRFHQFSLPLNLFERVKAQLQAAVWSVDLEELPVQGDGGVALAAAPYGQPHGVFIRHHLQSRLEKNPGNKAESITLNTLKLLRLFFNIKFYFSILGSEKYYQSIFNLKKIKFEKIKNFNLKIL